MEIIDKILRMLKVCMEHMKKRVQADTHWSLMSSTFKGSGMKEAVTDAGKNSRV